jgi:hypothetical protein
MNHIRLHSETSATGETAAAYAEWLKANPGRTAVPDILKCFADRPDFFRDVVAFSDRVHFRDGHLSYRVKEMLATLVSALNQCRY